MKDRILLVGEDSNLMATRAMLLSNWKTVTANSRVALDLIMTECFDGIVLCHTVRTGEANAIILRAKESAPAPAILAIRHPNDPELLGVVNHLRNLWESPAWLSANVSALLAERNIAV